jgi:CBS domain-containing protein
MALTNRVLDSVDEGRDRLADIIRPVRPRQRSLAPLWMVLGAAAGAVGTVLLRSQERSRTGTHGKKIRDVMIDKVVTIPASATLMEAAQRMGDSNVGVLPVVEGEQVSGVITDRDLVVRGLARHANAGTLTVGECATKIPVCARPEWDVEEAMRLMSEHRIGRLPVVDDANRLVGMVTLSSLALRSGDDNEALGAAQQVSRRSARA